MAENKKEKVKFEENEKRAFWIIGFAVILFLVLVFGGIILLKITRNTLDDVNNAFSGDVLNNTQSNLNYITSEDGEKENVSEGVVDAEFTIDGRRFSHFNIREYEGVTTIDFSIENETDEEVPTDNFLVIVKDDNGDSLEELSVTIRKIEPHGMEMYYTTLEEDLANAESIEVRAIAENAEEIAE